MEDIFGVVVNANISLYLIHQQDSGRCPWKSRADVCAHSVFPLGNKDSSDCFLGCVWHPTFLPERITKFHAIYRVQRFTYDVLIWRQMCGSRGSGCGAVSVEETVEQYYQILQSPFEIARAVVLNK